MANIELVIRIPEESYIALMEIKDALQRSQGFEKFIVNGTPLPKGHGRLVDMSEVLVKLMQYYDGNKTIGQCLDEVHTVIEAEGGDAE